MPGLLLVHGAVALSLLILGIFIARGRGLWLIAGYNTASPAEKAKIDQKALCRHVSRLLWFSAGCFTLLMVSDVLASTAVMVVALVLLFAGIPAGIIWMNTGDRLKKKGNQP